MRTVKFLEDGEVTIQFAKGEIIEFSDEMYELIMPAGLKMIPYNPRGAIPFNPVKETKQDV